MGGGTGEAAARPDQRGSPDPYAAVPSTWRATRSPSPTLPPFAGGAVGFFGYDLVRTVEPLGEPNPDPVGLPDMALMITDVLLAFDHQRHEVTVIANAFVEDGGIEPPTSGPPRRSPRSASGCGSRCPVAEVAPAG